MIIDWHTHVHTPDQAAQDFWQGAYPDDDEARPFFKLVDQLGLDAADKDKILGGNARKLLKLD